MLHRPMSVWRRCGIEPYGTNAERGGPEDTKEKPPEGGSELVEAAGQLFHPFRDGLDYAFILRKQDAGRVIRLHCRRILVPTRFDCRTRRAYESLQGKPEVGPLLTPRRC